MRNRAAKKAKTAAAQKRRRAERDVWAHSSWRFPRPAVQPPEPPMFASNPWPTPAYRARLARRETAALAPGSAA